MKIIAIVLALAAASLAHADSFTISLPGLTGGYEASEFDAPNFGYPYTRTVAMTIPAGVVAIDQLQFVVSGDWHEGELTCDAGSGPETSPFHVPLSLSIRSDAFPGDYFLATVQPGDGPFTDLTAPLTACCPPGVLDFADLLGVDLEVELIIDWAIIGICWITDDSYGTVDDVRLEITGTVGVEAETWSSVKALYR